MGYEVSRDTPARRGVGSVDFIPVCKARNLRVDQLPARRIALGLPNEEKLSLALLPDGQLLLTTFNIQKHGGRLQVDNFLFRSNDAGVT